MGPMGCGSGVGSSALLGGDAGDVGYPHYLVNGRIPAAPTTFTAAPGQRLRIRIVNAAADTAFRVALAGHTLTVTHTDGFPVVPVEVDALLIGMGERYDVLVTAADGVFPLTALAEGKNAARARPAAHRCGPRPRSRVRPRELDRRVAHRATDLHRRRDGRGCPSRGPRRDPGGRAWRGHDDLPVDHQRPPFLEQTSAADRPPGQRRPARRSPTPP